ncbi:tetratricopeptide repeat protein (macronuclear) [Tetrahymena thermophila SB210]|uniref:Tetratricopeptide repeat protein n=1 Tax=Tetrahymena thermophila (strain SB210) TaxID=312017 RepID=Q240Y2_TETTS|nr:tetratricopeptide repeat protein [Tetrahymena thermophila SB210]EAS02282.1 tetratricopeptide repeat protein [Tetrahymena thermophila SB210]|eukprot:XP_001022527.1 tetratricopeptide repeat protein [Tetrahymena thermophila SB210]
MSQKKKQDQITEVPKLGQNKMSENSENSDKQQRIHSKPSDEGGFDGEINNPRQQEINNRMIQFQKYMSQRDYPNAENEITELIKLNNTDATFYYLRAEVYMKQNKYIQSLQDMNLSVKYEPLKQCAKSSQYHYEIKKTLMQMSNDV